MVDVSGQTVVAILTRSPASGGKSRLFAAGLRKTNFPNPITAAHAGAVGFHLDGHSMTSDAAEWWFNTRAVGPFSDSPSHRGTV